MHIILACAAGMSTSLLARNIELAAAESNEKITVEAMSTSSLDDNSWQVADVVLIGPQMRHLLGQISAQGDLHQVPVAAIAPQNYALANGAAIIAQAKSLLEDK